MPEAFVLFKTEPTHEREVYLTLSDHEGVAEVHALYGEFDLLVRISSPTSKELSHLLMESFRRIDGVKDCLLYTSPSPRDREKSRMPSSA